MSERKWDYTTLNYFMQCPKKYYYRMIKHLEAKRTAPALLFGRAMHFGIEDYYKAKLDGKDFDECKECGINGFCKDFKDIEGETLRTTDTAKRVLNGYFAVYKNEPIRITDQEIGFCIPIGNYLYAGRMDARGYYGSVKYIFERKTTSMLRSNYFKQYNPNMQIDGYVYAEEMFTGEKCQGVMVDAIEVWKPVKRVTAKTKSLADHYVRSPEARTKWQLEQFEKDFTSLVEDVLRCEESGKFWRNRGNCFSYNYYCPYKELCMYGDDERIIKQDFKIEKWEPYAEKIEGEKKEEK